MKEIPFKNYVKLALICLAVIFLAITGSIWYKRNFTPNLDVPVIRGKLPEITTKDLEDYLIEHEDAYLYIGVASDENSRALEKNLIKILNKHDLTEDTVYLNVSDEAYIIEEFYKKFNDFHSVDEKLNNYPAYVIIKNNKIYKLIQRDSDFLTDKELDKFLGEVK